MAEGDDVWLGVKAACRAAGSPKRYAEVFRAIKAGVFPGEVRPGPRGVLVRPTDVRRCLLPGNGASTGATAPAPAPGALARVGLHTPSVAALRETIELRQLERVAARLDVEDARAARERADAEALAVARVALAREERLRHLALEAEARWLDAQTERALAALMTIAGSIATDLEAAVRMAVRIQLRALLDPDPGERFAAPDDGRTVVAIGEGLAAVLKPLVDQYRRREAERQHAEVLAAEAGATRDPRRARAHGARATRSDDARDGDVVPADLIRDT